MIISWMLLRIIEFLLNYRLLYMFLRLKQHLCCFCPKNSIGVSLFSVWICQGLLHYKTMLMFLKLFVCLCSYCMCRCWFTSSCPMEPCGTGFLVQNLVLKFSPWTYILCNWHSLLWMLILLYRRSNFFGFTWDGG